MKVVCTQNMTISGVDFKVKETYEVIGSTHEIGDYGLQTYYQYKKDNSGAIILLPEDFFVPIGPTDKFNTTSAPTAAYEFVGSVTNSIQDFKKAYKDHMGIDITPDNYRDDSKRETEVGLPPGTSGDDPK